MEELFEDCHTAQPGERCHADLVYAMRNRNVHPEWYFGLNNCSTLEDFQAFMHTQILNSGERRCPKPCKPRHAPHSACKRGKEEGRNCHTAVAGDKCYAHVLYTKKEVAKYPKWYPGLSEQSSLTEVQHYLHQENVCPEPCEIAEKQEADSKKLEGCHTALPGETCYADILLAKHKFILKHPEWYEGLSKDSSNDEFQALLHNQHHVDAEAAKKACPNPCNAKVVKEAILSLTCKTANAGDDCYNSVFWGATTGIISHPQWYGNLTSESAFEEFQLHLHKDNHTKCHHVPCPCRTAVKGDKCYASAKWVVTKGIKEHPEAYEGLDSGSTLEDVQTALHEQQPEACPRPCKTFPEAPRSLWKPSPIA